MTDKQHQARLLKEMRQHLDCAEDLIGELYEYTPGLDKDLTNLVSAYCTLRERLAVCFRKAKGLPAGAAF